MKWESEQEIDRLLMNIDLLISNTANEICEGIKNLFNELDNNLLIMERRSSRAKRIDYKMDFFEKLTLSPFEKYTRFNRFPWKFLFHLLLVVFTTYQALTVVSIEDKHSRIQEQVFSTIYLGTDDGSNTFPFYSLADFQDNFQGVFDQSKNLNDLLLQYAQTDNLIYALSVYYSEVNKDNRKSQYFQGNQDDFLQDLPFDPADITSTKTFLNNIQSMKLDIRNLVTYVSSTPNKTLDSCLNWTITIEYSFQSYANIQSKLTSRPFQCRIDDKRMYLQQNILFANAAVLLLSLISLVFSWRQIYEISKEYMRYKIKMEKEGGIQGSVVRSERSNSELEGSTITMGVDWHKTWEELGFFDKMKFFDIWFMIGAGGNFFQFIGAVVAILSESIDRRLGIFEKKETFIGFGAMFAWITMLKYLQYNQNLNLMTSTLSKAWSNLLMFIIGVMPFFFGFVFLGQCIFWKYSKFQDTSSSVITLFSLLNGDIVNDTFLQTWAEGLPGQLYLIIFMILFYTAVQNVFVTIIMEGYEESIKEKQHKKMLEEKENQERVNFEKGLAQHTHEEDQPLIAEALNEQDEDSVVVVSKLKVNSRRIDKVLTQMDKLLDEIESSQLSQNEKDFLVNIYKENLDNIGRNLKFQINNLGH